jgi:sirohydrochlorin cobaltochelatase
MTPPGLLIVGHGTRDVEGRAEFLALAELAARQCPERLVEACFLELAEPNIEAAVARLVERGLGTRLTVAPLLLFAAGHANHDIPEAVSHAVRNYPGLATWQAAHLGCSSSLVELSRQRYLEACRKAPSVDDGETLLLMVGRGSRDPSANSEFAQFARLRWETHPVGWLETCYTAMTEPSLEHALRISARLPFRRVVVQPHLLFRGELVSRIGKTVADFARCHPDIEWLTTAHLGPDALVAAAMLKSVQAVEAANAD